MAATTSKRTVCVSIDLRMVLNMDPARAGAMLRKNGRLMSSAEVKAHALILIMRGYVALPCCKNHDRQGFCRGHYTEADQG